MVAAAVPAGQVDRAAAGQRLRQATTRIRRGATRAAARRDRKPAYLLVHRYFAPDTAPYAQMLAAIADGLSHDAQTLVITGNRSYREPTASPGDPEPTPQPDYGVIRVPLLPDGKGRMLSRVLNTAVFAAEASAAVLAKASRGSIVMAATTPPIVVGFATAVATRLKGGKFIYHNEDIYPEILGSHPGFRSIALRWGMRRIDTVTGRLSTRVAVLSDDMKSVWCQRGISQHRVLVMPNFLPAGFHGAKRQEISAVAERRRELSCVYVGNIGPMQGLMSVLKALTRQDHVQVDVYGDGRSSQELRETPLPGVTYHGFLPPDRVAAVMEGVDLGIICLRPGVERAASPSKLMTLLEMGIPVLAFVDPRSSLAQEIEAERLGYVVRSVQDADVAAALAGYRMLSPIERIALRQRCQRYAERFEEPAAVARWRAVFATVRTGRPLESAS